MSQKSSKSSKVAYMEEEDDKGNIVDGVTYAASAAPSPTKMNVGRKKSHRERSPVAHNHTDSDSTVHPSRRDSRSSKSSRHRERSIPPSAKKAVAMARPQLPRHSNTAPVIEPASDRRRHRDQPTYYGIDPKSASSRPRSKTAAPRPNSYYAPPSRPPVSNLRYHSMHQPAMAPPPPPPPATAAPRGAPQFAPPPHPQWQHQHPPLGYGSMPPPPIPTPGPPPLHQEPFSYPGPPPPSHYDAFPFPGPTPPPGPPRDLHQRFNRPQTSIGHRPPPPVDYGLSDSYEPDDLTNSMRRLSMGYRPSLDEPMRPVSARPVQQSPFAPPPRLLPPVGRQPLSRFDEQFDEPESLYQDMSSHYEEAPLTHIPRQRRPSIDPSSYGYEPRPFATEVARTTGSRRNSYYGAQSNSSGSAFEDKLRVASSYQEDKGGGMRLTAEMLREASRGGGPRSRSTRSSGSRDESDWRQSATTRTTRSSNEEDLTIRVRGGILEMQCQDGTEINIRGPPTSRHYGNGDRSVYGEIEDRRIEDRRIEDRRYERPALRGRAASQAESVYAPPTNAQYDYAYGADEYDDSPFAPLASNRYI